MRRKTIKLIINRLQLFITRTKKCRNEFVKIKSELPGKYYMVILNVAFLLIGALIFFYYSWTFTSCLLLATIVPYLLFFDLSEHHVLNAREYIDDLRIEYNSMLPIFKCIESVFKNVMTNSALYISSKKDIDDCIVVLEDIVHNRIKTNVELLIDYSEELKIAVNRIQASDTSNETISEILIILECVIEIIRVGILFRNVHKKKISIYMIVFIMSYCKRMESASQSICNQLQILYEQQSRRRFSNVRRR